MTEKTHQQNIQIEQNSENGCALLVLFYFDGRTVLFPTNRIEIELTGADALSYVFFEHYPNVYPAFSYDVENQPISDKAGAKRFDYFSQI